MVAFGLKRSPAKSGESPLGAKIGSSSTTGEGATAARACDDIVNAVGAIILGKEDAIRLAVAAMLARGHVLIEDLPGVGKTTLAHALAAALGGSFQRIQFTADLLPADILGVSIFNQSNATFEFQAGPIFANVVLADEVNRATPKTQSALLEAMEENQVTQDRITRALPQPFFVLATQNPLHQIGTFPLPESQLDRFLMRLQLGYPSADAERALLLGNDRRAMLGTLTEAVGAQTFADLQNRVRTIAASEALIDYLQALIEFTRNSGEYAVGLSPRAGLGLLAAARAWAMMAGREHVMPEDIQAVVPGVVGHRLRLVADANAHRASSPDAVAELLLTHVAIP